MGDEEGSEGGPPRSFLARSRELASLAARIGGRQIGLRLNSALSKTGPTDRLRVQIEQATELVRSLGRLKGAAMKVGQLLSLEGADFLPPEVLEILSQLRDSGSALPEAVARKSLANELGEAALKRFESLDLHPIASASIGQVHRARCDGHELAIKLQFPGIAETIDADLAVLRRSLSGFLALSRREIPIDGLFEELESLLKQETDYRREADSLERYARELKNCGAQNYVLPSVYREFTTGRVLTMSFERGLRIPDWLRLNPSQKERDQYGQLVLDLYHLEFFRIGLVQTDPNFSNFLVRPDEGKLVLLDFGAVREYTTEFRHDYIELLKLMRGGSDAQLLEKSVAMELVSPLESDECRAAFVRMLRLSVEPFRAERQPFVFADADYSKEVRNATVAFTGMIRHSPPPRSLIFLHRKLGGIFNLLKTLEARLDLGPYWESLVKSP